MLYQLKKKPVIQNKERELKEIRHKTKQTETIKTYKPFIKINTSK